MIVEQFLGRYRSPATRQAYDRDLRRLASFLDLPLEELLSQELSTATESLRQFTATLKDDRPRTIKRRLAVISSFISYAHQRGLCAWQIHARHLFSFRSPPPRPPLTLPPPAQLAHLINLDTLAGKRDYALLTLVSENLWKRSELTTLNCQDLDQLPIPVSPATSHALSDWLSHHPHPHPPAPLFTALDRQHWGQRLSTPAIYQIINKYRHSPAPPISSEYSDQPESPSPLTPRSPHADLISALIADRRSPNTKRAYQKDLQYFFQSTYQQSPHPHLVEEFLQLDRFQAIALVLQYKAQMIANGLKEATVNRRLAALKSLVTFANKLGHCQWSLTEIQGEPIQAYRDTTGIPPSGIKAILQTIDRQHPAGKRDYAILRLLWDNALRRQEIASLSLKDIDHDRRTLSILSKGKGEQKTIISLNLPTHQAISTWQAELAQLGHTDPNAPLFIALDPAHQGHRLSGTTIYNLVKTYAQKAGISKLISPHRIRHSAITAALDATNGNVRKVQKLSRHKKLDTLMIYDDNRANLQGEISNLLSDLI